MATLTLLRCKRAVARIMRTAAFTRIREKNFATLLSLRSYSQSPTAFLLLILINSDGAAAQTETLEYQVKAAFLYQFPAYVDWPAASFADSASPLVYGMLEADAIADELTEISRANLISGRSIVVRKMQPDDSTGDLHVLFVGEPRNRALEPVLLQALANSILTITEAPEQPPDTSVINFAIIDGKVRFDVSLIVAERARLTISSRLLQVARRVIEPNP
jgi:hypothetical protein